MTTGHADDQGRHVALLKTEALRSAPHVLIADNHPAIQEMLRWALELAGYRASSCAGRDAALSWRDRAIPSGDCPALILFDLSIPDTNDAADFLHHLRARWHDAYGVLPQIIVLTTNKKLQEDLAPMERVLQKPFHIRDLIALIQQVIPVASRSEDCSSRKEHSSDD